LKKTLNPNKAMVFLQDALLLPTFSGFFEDTSFMSIDIVLAEIMRKRNVLLTSWKDFNRVPKKIENEQYICVVKGQEQYKIVSPIFRKNIYVGAYNNLRRSDTPLDFFNYNP